MGNNLKTHKILFNILMWAKKAQIFILSYQQINEKMQFTKLCTFINSSLYLTDSAID